MPKYYFENVPTESPRHHVKISKPFYLGMYQVTQDEYEKVMGLNPSAFTEKQMEASSFKPPLDQRRSKSERRTPRRPRVKTPAVTRWRRSIGMTRWSSAANCLHSLTNEPPNGPIVCRPKRSGNLLVVRERRPAGIAATMKQAW